MTLRLATLADAPAIAELHAASWRSTYADALDARYLSDVVPAERLASWTQRLASPAGGQSVIVAQAPDGLAGFACVFAGHHAQWGAYLENLHVRAASQGQGVGRALLSEAARRCEARTPGTGLYLSVNQTNLRAQGFYLGLGACNEASAVWHAPDGSDVPTFWFTWPSAASLAAACRAS